MNFGQGKVSEKSGNFIQTKSGYPVKGQIPILQIGMFL